MSTKKLLNDNNGIKQGTYNAIINKLYVFSKIRENKHGFDNW